MNVTVANQENGQPGHAERMSRSPERSEGEASLCLAR